MYVKLSKRRKDKKDAFLVRVVSLIISCLFDFVNTSFEKNRKKRTDRIVRSFQKIYEGC